MVRRSIVVVSLLAFALGCGEAPRYGRLLDVPKSGVTLNGHPAVAGTAIASRDEIVVEKGGFARIQFEDKTKIFLWPDPKGGPTRFSIDGYAQQSSSKTLLMKLMRGIVTLVVPKDRKPADVLEVQASYTTTAIRGTELKVSTGDDGDEVCVKQGSVEVRSNEDPKQTVTVSTQERLEFKPRKGFSAKATYDPVAPAERSLYEPPLTLNRF